MPQQESFLKQQEARLAEERQRILEALGDPASRSGENGSHEKYRFCQLLPAVEAALSHIALGDYGTCGGCGEKISPARLKAFPAARLCIDCKTEEERRAKQRS